MNTTQVSAGSAASKKAITTHDIVLVGMFGALLTAVSQISLPMPTGVPITIQVFGVALVGTVLGWKLGFLSTVVYILLGAVGLPVFANFHGGIQSLMGMTGGYIMAWPVMAFLSGIHLKTENKKLNLAAAVVLSLIGLMIVEFAGAFQWSRLTSEMSLGAIIVYSFVAFIPKDIVITVAAVVVGSQIRKPLVNAGYLKS